MKKIVHISLFALLVVLGYHCHLEQPTIEEEDPIAKFDVSFEDNCAYPPVKVSFENKSTNFTNIKWYFNYGKTSDSSTLLNPTYTYLQAGTYEVRLEVTNKLGISSLKVQVINVQKPDTWAKDFPSKDVDYPSAAYSVQQTSDEGYITTGFTSGEGAGGRDLVLIKILENGNQSWKKTYGGTANEEGFSVKQTADLGNIIVGYTRSEGKGEDDVYLIKTNWLGTVEWKKTYGSPENDRGYSVQQTKDGGYIVVGETGEYSTSDVYVIKTDTKGDIEWTKKIGTKNKDFGRSVQETTDGGFIISGITDTWNSGRYVSIFLAFLVKLKNNGDIQWTTALEDLGESVANSVQQTTDGGYILVGSSTVSNNQDIFLAKVSSEGLVNFQKRYGNNSVDENGYSVKQLPDRGYILSGHSDPEHLYLIRTDEKGDIIKEKKLQYASSGRSEINLTKDCGFIIATSYLQDLHLIKLNKNMDF